MAGDGRDGRCINSRCVHAAAGRDGHGRFERREEDLKLETVDVPKGRGTLKLSCKLWTALKFPYDGALEAALKVPPP